MGSSRSRVQCANESLTESGDGHARGRAHQPLRWTGLTSPKNSKPASQIPLPSPRSEKRLVIRPWISFSYRLHISQVAVFILLLLCFNAPAQSLSEVSLAWEASTDPAVASYRLYVGLGSGSYTEAFECGTNLTATVPDLVVGSTYYFVVRAVSAEDVESEPSNEVTYTVPQPDSIQVASYVSSFTAGTLRNDFSGYVGMQMVTSSKPITVTALGRLMCAGNSGTHVVKLVKAADGTDVPGGAVTVKMSGVVAGQFVNADLATSVVLEPYTAYYVVSQEVANGDVWYDVDAAITGTAAAQVTSGIWGYGAGMWYTYGGAGHSYGPLNVVYLDPSATTTTTVKFVTDRSLGSLRSDFSGFVGMKIDVGASPLTVATLGRLMCPGNTATHTVKLVKAADGTDVTGGATTVTMSGATLGEFVHGTLASPVTLQANTSYLLLSQETAGGDAWYDVNTTVTTTTAASVSSGAWGYGGGAWYTYGSAGNAYVPLDFSYTTTTTTTAADTTFVTSQTPGPLRNNFTGFVGMRVDVSTSPISVTEIGRFVCSGNSGTHTVKFVRASDGVDIAGGSVSIATSGTAAGKFAYAKLSTPVTLAANTSYYLVTQETASGDQWYDVATTVTTTSAGVVKSAAWGYGNGSWFVYGGVGQCYGPVDFKYTSATSTTSTTTTSTEVQPTAYVTSQTLGTLRNNFTGFVGMRIDVGAQPLVVSSLGRMISLGNTKSHVVKLVYASNGADVADGSATVAAADGVAGQYQYAELPMPVTLTANTSYYIVSQETAGGDSWYDVDTSITTGSVATTPSAAWSLGSGAYYTYGSSGQCYGPLNFKYTVSQ